MISEAYIETKSTVNLLLMKLTAELPKVMVGHGNNVKDFNNEIRETILKAPSSIKCCTREYPSTAPEGVQGL